MKHRIAVVLLFTLDNSILKDDDELADSSSAMRQTIVNCRFPIVDFCLRSAIFSASSTLHFLK
jgi:hypothetical protein